MSQLRKEHTHYVAPRTEGSRHGIHAGLACKFRNKMRRNQIAKLSENAELGSGWFGRSFYHLCRVTKLKSHANHFFCVSTEIPMGRLCMNSASLHLILLP